MSARTSRRDQFLNKEEHVRNVLGCLDRPTDGTYLLKDRRTDRMTAAELAQVMNR